MSFLLRRRDQKVCSANEITAKQTVKCALQTKTARNRTIHSHRFDYVGNSTASAVKGHNRPEQVVKTVDMNYVERCQIITRELYHVGIPRNRSKPGTRP